MHALELLQSKLQPFSVVGRPLYLYLRRVTHFSITCMDCELLESDTVQPAIAELEWNIDEFYVELSGTQVSEPCPLCCPARLQNIANEFKHMFYTSPVQVSSCVYISPLNEFKHMFYTSPVQVSSCVYISPLNEFKHMFYTSPVQVSSCVYISPLNALTEWTQTNWIGLALIDTKLFRHTAAAMVCMSDYTYRIPWKANARSYLYNKPARELFSLCKNG